MTEKLITTMERLIDAIDTLNSSVSELGSFLASTPEEQGFVPVKVESTPEPVKVESGPEPIKVEVKTLPRAEFTAQLKPLLQKKLVDPSKLKSLLKRDYNVSYSRDLNEEELFTFLEKVKGMVNG